MATLNLPIFTLEILVWYHDPPTQPSVPQLVLTLVQPIETLSCLPPIPSKNTPISTLVPRHPKKAGVKAAKATTKPRPAPPCMLCDTQGHATQNCPELPILHTHMEAMDTSNCTPVLFTVPNSPTFKNKSLRTNHPCAVCELYGHYSHHCQDLTEYQSTIRDLRQHSSESDITILEEFHPATSSLDTTNTIYMISSSASPSISPIVEDPSDLFMHCFKNDEDILQYISTLEYPWNDMHHRSLFVPDEPLSSSDQ